MNRKTIKLSAIALASMAISACNKPSEPQKLITDSIPTQDSVETQKIDSFLITNTKAGLFDVNDTIGGLAQAYGYEVCRDSDLFFPDVEDDSIAALEAYHKPNEKSNLLKKNTIELTLTHKRAVFKYGKEPARNDKRYLVVDNCGETFYYKDSISGIQIRSPKFKTKEGIGVGSTFKDLQKAYKGLKSVISVSSENGAILAFVTTKEYPNIWFQFGVQFDGDEPEDEFKCFGPEDGSHFNPNGEILYIIIER